MHVYAVGQPYTPGRVDLPEGADYNYRAGQHELRIFWRRPSDAEVRAISEGKIELGMFTERSASGYPLVALLYRISDTAPGGRGQVTSWSDASFAWHLVPEDERERPPTLAGEERVALTIILVDSASGLIRAMRYASMSPKLSQRLHDVIREQWAWEALDGHTFDRAAYNAEIRALYARHPQSSDFLLRADVRGWLGE